MPPRSTSPSAKKSTKSAGSFSHPTGSILGIGNVTGTSEGCTRWRTGHEPHQSEMLSPDKCHYLSAGNIAILSVRPQHALAIECGRKTAEFRKRFCKRVRPSAILFYATSPASRFSALARLSEVQEGSVELLWDQYKCQGGCSLDDYRQYFDSSRTGVALLLSEVYSIVSATTSPPVGLAVSGFRPPQSFAVIDSTHPVVHWLVQSCMLRRSNVCGNS